MLRMLDVCLCLGVCVCAIVQKSGALFTVDLQGAGCLGFAHAVLRHACVRALILASHLCQTQAVVAADLKPERILKCRILHKMQHNIFLKATGDSKFHV